MKTNTYTGSNKSKVCFCIGAENCQDESCELVQKHKKRLKEWKETKSKIQEVTKCK